LKDSEDSDPDPCHEVFEIFIYFGALTVVSVFSRIALSFSSERAKSGGGHGLASLAFSDNKGL